MVHLIVAKRGSQQRAQRGGKSGAHGVDHEEQLSAVEQRADGVAVAAHDVPRRVGYRQAPTNAVGAGDQLVTQVVADHMALFAASRLLLNGVVAVPIAQKLQFLQPADTQLPPVDRLAHHVVEYPQQRIVIERLGNEPVHSQIDGRHQRLVVQGGGHQDQRRFLIEGADLAEHLLAREAGHDLVAQHDVGAMLGKKLQPPGAVLRHPNMPEKPFESQQHQLAAGRFVLHQQQGQGGGPPVGIFQVGTFDKQAPRALETR